jgi:hypothetical protein
MKRLFKGTVSDGIVGEAAFSLLPSGAMAFTHLELPME